MNGASSVREVEIATGRVLRSRRLPQRDFGEGLTRHGDRAEGCPGTEEEGEEEEEEREGVASHLLIWG